MTESQLHIECPKCGAPYRVAEAMAGRTVSCRRCGASFAVGDSLDRSTEQRLGELAVRFHMLSAEQVAEVLAEAFMDDPNRPGARFVAAGALTADQLDYLLALQTLKTERNADLPFGELAVSHGWAQRADIDTALSEQKRIFARERRTVLIGDLLVERGILSAERRDQLLAEQNRQVASPEPEQETRIVISVSDDRMRVVATLSDGGTRPTPEEVEAELAEFGVVHGIDGDAIERLCAAGPGEPGMLVAEGTPPTPSVDGSVDYLFDLHPLKAGRQGEDGVIDFRDRGEIPQVEPGMVLARKTPPQPGSPGQDVHGAAINPAPPKDVGLSAGVGAEISGDHTVVTATAEGYPSVAATGIISVFPEYAIEGDVGYNTGHVNFHGRVIVSGIVQSGFRVRCGELVARELEATEIEADGDVAIAGGIIGARVKAGGSVKAKYLHKAKLEVLGDVIIERELVDSEVQCSGTLHAERCKILSSNISARDGVHTREVGSDASVPCTIAVGIDERVLAETARLEEAIEAIRTAAQERAGRLLAIGERNTTIDGQIGKLAQIQDKAMVRQRELQGSGNAAEIAQVERSIADAETALTQLFAEQERLNGENESLAALEQGESEALAALEAERESLVAWSREHVGKPVIQVDGTLHQQTLIRTPHKETRITGDRKRVFWEEREVTTEDGNTVWRLTPVT